MSLATHLASGLTTVCRCWAVTRKDGSVFGFTDHDVEMAFDGLIFKADTGLTASALQTVTGLAVDNSEAVGALSHASVTERDIATGRFDGAEVKAWLVNWRNPDDRELRFLGTLGELVRRDGAFHAELRGISENLNTPMGRIFQKPCQAILGDTACSVNLGAPGYRAEIAVEEISEGRVFTFVALAGFDDRWFEKGRVEMLNGHGEGLVGVIKNDRVQDGKRVIELWEEIREEIVPGDMIRLDAGCDKRAQTCRLKFQNIENFRGFPHIPGDDWLMSYPAEDGGNNGGSLFS